MKMIEAKEKNLVLLREAWSTCSLSWIRQIGVRWYLKYMLIKKNRLIKKIFPTVLEQNWDLEPSKQSFLFWIADSRWWLDIISL